MFSFFFPSRRIGCGSDGNKLDRRCETGADVAGSIERQVLETSPPCDKWLFRVGHETRAAFARAGGVSSLKKVFLPYEPAFETSRKRGQLTEIVSIIVGP